MKKVNLKKLLDKSYKYRNEQAIKKLVEYDERTKFNFVGEPKEFQIGKVKSPFKIGSLLLSIRP